MATYPLAPFFDARHLRKASTTGWATDGAPDRRRCTEVVSKPGLTGTEIQRGETPPPKSSVRDFAGVQSKPVATQEPDSNHSSVGRDRPDGFGWQGYDRAGYGRGDTLASSYEDRKAKVDTIMALTSVQEQLTSVLPTVASRSHGVTDAVYSLLLQSAACESPLEAIFVGWWIGISWLFNDANGSREITLSPQVDVRCGTDRYRLDFQVTLADRSGYYAQAEREHRLTYPLIGIELDGHDFHERTKEQVAYRDRRDRALQIAGWRVFHISGSELYRRGYEAVSDVYEHAHDEWVELHAAIYHAGR